MTGQGPGRPPDGTRPTDAAPGPAGPARAATARRADRAWAIAHRGEPRGFRENTPAGIAEAVRLGAGAVEVDVRATRDGVAVLHHDPTLERLWGSGFAVADLTVDRLRAVAPGVPLLAEVLPTLADHGVPLVLDVGSAVAARAAVEAAREVGARWSETPSESDVWFCGDPGALAWLRAEHVPAPRLLSWDWWRPVPAGLIRAVDPTFFNPWHRLLSPRAIARWHDRGVAVCTWTVDSAARRRRLLRWGIDAVISNDVAGAVADAAAVGGRAAE